MTCEPKVADNTGRSTGAEFGAARALVIGLIAILATLAAIWLFFRPPPPILESHFKILSGTNGVWLGAAGMFFALLAPRRYRSWLAVCWLLVWQMAGLSELRSGVITDGIVIGGVIPYSDACNYIQESSTLIEGRNMSAWGARRPLADAYLAGVLYLARERVSIAVALAGILIALAIGIAAIEIRNSMGIVAAICWTWVLLFYWRRYIGEFMSEQAGIALGTMATAILVRAFASRIRSLVYLGLFVLAMALNARAGTFFVLPFILAAGIWVFRGAGGIRFLSIGAVTIIAAMLINYLFLKGFGPAHGKAVSNYHNVIYGIVFNADWQRAAVDIPNYSQMDEAAQAKEVYRRVFAAIKNDPMVLWRGAARSWSDFIGGSYRSLGAFSFLRDPRFETVLLILGGVGTFGALAVKNPVAPLIVATALGILVSVPFLPPADADLMRAYAATVPLMVLIPWVSFRMLGSAVDRVWKGIPFGAERPAASQSTSSTNTLVYLSLPLLFVLLVVPVFARFIAPVTPSAFIATSENLVELSVDLSRVSWIELSDDKGNAGDSLRRVSPVAFRDGIFGSFRFLYPKQAKLLESLASPGVIFAAPGASGATFLVMDAKHVNDLNKLTRVSGNFVKADDYYGSCFIESSVLDRLK